MLQSLLLPRYSAPGLPSINLIPKGYIYIIIGFTIIVTVVAYTSSNFGSKNLMDFGFCLRSCKTILQESDMQPFSASSALTHSSFATRHCSSPAQLWNQRCIPRGQSNWCLHAYHSKLVLTGWNISLKEGKCLYVSIRDSSSLRHTLATANLNHTHTHTHTHTQNLVKALASARTELAYREEGENSCSEP